MKKMPIIDTTQYQNSFQSTAKAKTFEQQSSLGKEAFLKLLVTQLQNQDPTQPLQDREFIAQMTQFSTLEQMTNLNDMFSKFVEGQNIGGLSNMIGKKVTWTDRVVSLDQAGNEQWTEVAREGIVNAVSMKEGKSQLVLQDGTKVDVSRVETITNPPVAPTPPATESESETKPSDQGDSA
ncbi:flagellar hook assembly protein FlgD [Aneurinibacillus sp. BA2021]|nr:flagellar hook assembly protein FlgD [Aneurinibacillus sp. BA2021]